MKALTATAAILMIATGPAFAGDFDPAEPVVVQREALAYFNVNPAIEMADAYGALAETAHGTFGKFPANFDSGAHTHSAAYHGIVLKGVMTNPFEGEENPPEMTPGSYWYVPAGMEHATACVSDAPCEFFFFSEAGFDFHPVE